MIKRMLVICLIFMPISVSAQNWPSCQGGLSNMSGYSQNASVTAMNLSSISQNIESLSNHLRNCQRDPNYYDLMKDGCEVYRLRLNNEIERYNSEINKLSLNVNNIVNTLNSTLQWCGFK